MSGFASLTRLLHAAQVAAPVDAVNALTREVGKRLGAVSVSFLIADMSGRALVRLVHVSLDPDGQTPGASTLEAGHRTLDEESATTVPFDGGPVERVVRSQRPEVIPPEHLAGQRSWTVLAPVTERGEAIGVLELWRAELAAPYDCGDAGERFGKTVWIAQAGFEKPRLPYQWAHGHDL